MARRTNTPTHIASRVASRRGQDAAQELPVPGETRRGETLGFIPGTVRPNKTMLLLDGLKELKRVRDHAHEPQARPGVQHPPAFVPLMELLLDGEREASLLFVVEDVARELRVPYATALGWVIEFFDEKLDPALAVEIANAAARKLHSVSIRPQLANGAVIGKRDPIVFAGRPRG